MSLALLKTSLLWLGLLLLAVLSVLFASYYIREWLADMRLRRNARTKFAGQTIARDYRHRESPAWERVTSETRPGRRYRVEAALRDLGE